MGHCCSSKPNVKKLEALRMPDKGMDKSPTARIALAGNPNVGKSVIFNCLTGAYVTVSNYPGTTVEVSRGWYTVHGTKLEVIDTPGMYSMLPITEEERVTRTLLMSEKPDLVVHVIDAKNIQRMLPLTMQLTEAGFPVILVLNIMDEANLLGVSINTTRLGEMLGVQVVEASAALNRGINDVRNAINRQLGIAPDAEPVCDIR